MTATVTTLPAWPEDVPVHPAAELFPLMSGADFDELVRDVKENGLVTAIVRTPDGLILDGRNRYRACLMADVEPSFETHGGEPWKFVISTNLHRRHLTDSQRAMVAAKIAERGIGWNRHSPGLGRPDGQPATLPPSQAEAAGLLNVSERQVRRARTVQKQAAPALRAAVEAGVVPISTAARVSALPTERQDEFVERVASGVKAVVAAPATEDKVANSDQASKARPRYAMDERVAGIREFAPKGLTSRQIADEIGVSDEYVRRLARENDIEIPADVVVSRSRRVDSNRVVRETVHTLEGLAMGVALVNPSDLDRSEVGDWSKSLTDSIRAINRLIKQMKELDQ